VVLLEKPVTVGQKQARLFGRLKDSTTSEPMRPDEPVTSRIFINNRKERRR
jgi:hypothetical protein